MIYYPLPCQEEGAKFMIDNPRSGILFKMGIGKTVTALTAAEQLMYNYMRVRRALVLAPKRVATMTWPDEIEKWNHTRDLTYTVLHGADKLEKLKTEAHEVDITLINYEGLQWLSQHYDEYAPKYDLLISDESTYLKNAGSNRTKLAHAIGRDIRYIFIMTGTPKPNGIANLWSQIYLLDRGHRLGTGITSFRNEYMLQKDQRLWVPKHGAKKKVLDKIKDLVLVVEDTTGVGLPRVKDNIIDLELPPKARKTYHELETKWVTNVSDSELLDEITLKLDNKQSLTQKLRQLSGGFIYTDEGILNIHSVKLKALEELMEGVQGNLLVGINFKYEVDIIRKHFGYRVPAIYSKTNDKEGTKWIREWMAGKVPLMMANPASLAHGMNMQGGGCDIVWFSLTWDLEMWEQLIARLRRRGSQYETVFNHVLRMRDTIDDIMLKIVTTKGIEQAEALDYLREYRKKLMRKK
jgi:SNF2 family DNA or RNA helicase